MLIYALWPYRGDTGRWRFILWADGAKTEPVDLAGVTVEAEIRPAPGGLPVIALGTTVTAPNIIDLTLTPAASATIPTVAVWDLQLTYASGDVQTILGGAVKARGDVTDSQAVTVMGVAHA